ncbi:acyl-CoA/acyl-ACP dehydrogenase [Metallosphaera tengchongensis]|uniref:Acyl-CoA/acyl-ACP dehydrogenase n=1 Tax=Metallosphaera tengchongensis TaxID=1532350 RepID=A0A6N0NTQ1_9CREN|nr:acyl-CoA dehydrogenase family protein [Metallosphaera tengchongensis]QKR00072.1 acyl-CoA/acyl-ACP dehydrogenase [Metallosphaera tengchongensis]
MDFSLTEEERLFQEELREFLQKELRPITPKIDREGIPHEFVKKAAPLGIWAMPVSQEVGGQGASFLVSSIAAEEIARADFSMATAVLFLLESGWGYVLDKYGSRDLRETVLPKVTSGDWFLGIASTEPTGGSDVAGIKTTAKRENSTYLLNGQKIYISGVTEALEWGGGHLTLAKTSPEAGHKGISMFYVPIKSKGVEVSKIENMGRMGISSGILRYLNAEVPENFMVGEKDKGFYYAMDGFNHARVLVSAACVGAGETILDMGIEYVKSREVFSKKLKDYEAIAFEAAELKTRLEMAKLLTYKAAWMMDRFPNSDETAMLAAMSKLTGPQTAFEIIKSVMMWMGAYGYTKDALIEMGFRGVVSYMVGAEGAMNVMKLIISKRLFG